MRNISKPPVRKRTDGVEFDPPRNFVLPPTRFADLPRDIALYSPDELDRAFVERSEQMRLCDPYTPLTLRVVSVLLGAFESQSSAYLRQLYQIQKKERGNNDNDDDDDDDDDDNDTGGGVSNTQNVLTASNRDLLQKVSIHIPEVLRNADEEDHPLAGLDKDNVVVKKVHESIKGHWIEKRCAFGTFISAQLRPCAIENGLLSNTTLGEEDEPFVDRDIQDPLVTWRESAEHAVILKERAGESVKAIKAAKKEARRKTDTAQRDRATTKHFVKTALALMTLVQKREELRLEHMEATVAELALARRCRQIPPQFFSTGMMSGQPTPAPPSKKGGGASAAASSVLTQEHQQRFLAQQFLSQQQLVPLVTPRRSNNPLAGEPASTLQPQQLEPLVEELVLAGFL